ncbi:MAG: putative bifunctional diguanylate cyclase/phosphodiesterase, partial [Mycobacteriales bacterium]
MTTLVGLPLAVWLGTAVPGADRPVDNGTLAALTAALFVGELLPIQIVRNGRHSDEITISTTFALALILVAPLGVAVVAQAVPLVIDDVRRRKDWTRPLFNVAQYTLTFAATRLAYALVAGQGFLQPERFRQDDLLAAAAAGLVFFTVNHGLVGTAVALWSREPVLGHLLDDIRFQLSTAGLLVCLAPLVIVASDFSLWLVPVLLLPMAAVRKSAQLAAQREHDALHDILTGLPNRSLLHLELGRALAEAQRGGRGLAVVLIDLDHFKEINDTLGHHVGDLLIVEVGNRLRQVAADDLMVARLGGDEFAVLYSPALTPERCRLATIERVEELRAGLAEPLTLAGVRLDVQASMGIALHPEHGQQIDALIARADVAMYAAKEDRGGWAIYDPEEDQHTPERLALLAELRDGIGRGELVLHYQPKCRARTGEVVGVEALVRWNHPRRGLLMPDEFVPMAENTGLVTDLTAYVLDQALRQERRWLDQGRTLGIAVNLSVRHLTDLTLPGSIAAALRRHDVPPPL